MPSRSERKSAKRIARRDAKIAQIRRELAEGQVASALARARGLASTFPFSTAVHDVTGEACHQAGELLSAGLHWSLSGRDDPIAIECIRRFEAVHPTASAAFKAYGFRWMPFGRFDSARVNDDLEAMRERLLQEGYDFEPMLARARHDPEESSTLGGVVVLAALLAFLGILCAGVWQIGTWIFG